MDGLQRKTKVMRSSNTRRYQGVNTQALNPTGMEKLRSFQRGGKRCYIWKKSDLVPMRGTRFRFPEGKYTGA